ncbi:TIM barrel protein (plasmid) [Rhodococcus pseudokoreensis]|uniref:TIM barrel protein n=1 Tax=Rhodococcus pseudokoreensis TaxID=2811421 RepID=A0A974ZRR3_9NOCA|nr:TIM barrel protein [Rhodococcus pseudokoreensis]QSE88001.1 TIM barrel protein [Rhodococcus pseudokoreensis]
MVSPTYAVNCSILLTDLPLLKRPQAARDAGFDAVEFWWPFSTPVPSDEEVDSFVRAIQDADVQLTGLNFAAGDMPAGDRGILSDAGHVSAFRDNVDVAIGIAESLGTKAFNALYGNRLDAIEGDRQDAIAAENLAIAGRAAEKIGAFVLIEPVSGTPAYPLKTAAEAIAVIDRVKAEHGVDSLRLLADLYHLEVNGDDVGAAIDTYAARIGHVQIADAPGRGEPGTGTLDIDGYLKRLAGHGYRGYVGLEYKATRPDTFDWLPREHRATRAAH